ncbi:MAG TPA: PilZ domain-containing protein [Xanthobacteraceae bacterium]|nr:PilZ domain-containing protein [Xanthobacteraceae bacterium]
MSTAYRNSAIEAKFLRREYDRSAVVLPAIVTLGDQEYGARILNLARGGAMIECSAFFPPATSFMLRCGSIAADSVVVWQKSDQYGVNFRFPLSEAQVTEQLSRNIAIRSRKLPEGQSDSSTDRRPKAGTGHEILDAVRSSASASYLSAIEASHRQVESYVFALETIMTGELSDIGQFSAARLRLRQANLARTQVALDACRHLMTVQPAQPSLRDLQRRELDISQMISLHVQQWTTQSLQDDWSGYCRATRKVLKGVRELIAAEKKLLCPALRGGTCEHRPQ